MKNFIGRGSGESIQMAFAAGWVLVQPSEGRVQAGAGGGGGGRTDLAGRSISEDRPEPLHTSVREVLRYASVCMVDEPDLPRLRHRRHRLRQVDDPVIRDLAEGRSRFCELERSLAGISPRTLSLRLRALEEQGIVARHTYPEVPPRVEYSLTPKGARSCR